MKRGLFVLFVAMVLVFNSFTMCAEALKLTYDGKVHEYTGNIYTLKVDGEVVNSDLPPIIINGRSLVLSERFLKSSVQRSDGMRRVKK